MENSNNRAKYPVIQTRVTPVEKESIKSKIGELNSRPDIKSSQRLTESKVFRHFLRLFIKDGMELSPDAYLEVRSAALYLAGASRNLNQIARKVNFEGLSDEGRLHKRLDSLETSIDHFKRSLLKMLNDQERIAMSELLEGVSRE